MRPSSDGPRYEEGEKLCQSCKSYFNVYDKGEVTNFLCRECYSERHGRPDETNIQEALQRRIREEYRERTGYPTGSFDPERLARQVHDELMETFSPRVLREKFVILHGEWREKFKPRTLNPSTVDELTAELERFLAYESTLLYNTESAKGFYRRYTETVIKKIFGGYPMAETNLWQTYESKGLPHILDLITQHEQRHHLDIYVKDFIKERLEPLRPAARRPLEDLYLESLRSLPNMGDTLQYGLGVPDGRYPTRWYRMLKAHAEKIVFG